MATAETVREKALSLAVGEASIEEAVRELLQCCADRRVPVVLARQQLLEGGEGEADAATARAVELIDETLRRLSPEA